MIKAGRWANFDRVQISPLLLYLVNGPVARWNPRNGAQMEGSRGYSNATARWPPWTKCISWRLVVFLPFLPNRRMGPRTGRDVMTKRTPMLCYLPMWYSCWLIITSQRPLHAQGHRSRLFLLSDWSLSPLPTAFVRILCCKVYTLLVISYTCFTLLFFLPMLHPLFGFVRHAFISFLKKIIINLTINVTQSIILNLNLMIWFLWHTYN